MKRTSTRRRFVMAAGAASVALAGCIGSSRTDGDGTTTAASNTTTGASNTTTTSGGSGSRTTDPGIEAPFQRGELLEDFERAVGDRWGRIVGSFTEDTNEVYAGSQSVRLVGGETNAAGIFRSFADGLDLTQHDLSVAVKMKQPQAGKVALEVLAPGRSDHLVSQRYIPQEMDGWTRIDFGYTGKRGDPMMDAVQEIRLLVQTDGAPIEVWLDDLRLLPKPDKGAVIFQFDDAVLSTHEVAYPVLSERGWPGSVGVIPRVVNSEGNLSDGMLRTMRSDGWTMMSHPQESRPLPTYTADEQRTFIEDAKRWLELKGFPEGAKHFVAPYNRVSEETLSILADVGHETAFMYGACPSNALQTSAPLFISRVNGRDTRGTRRILNLAEEYNQLVTIAYHDVAAEGEDASARLTVPWEDFLDVVDHVYQKDVDVVAPSDLIANW